MSEKRRLWLPFAVGGTAGAALWWLISWANGWLLLALVAMCALLGLVRAYFPTGARGDDADDGLLSFDALTRRCAELQAPPVYVPTVAPEGLPEPLRDPAFVAWERRPRRRPQAATGPAEMTVGEWKKGRPPSDREIAAPTPPDVPYPRPITEREFAPHTHCPAGHIATHHVTGQDEHDGTALVLRECWWESCAATWAEKAWTQPGVVAR